MFKILLLSILIISSVLAQNQDYELSTLTTGTKTLNKKMNNQLSFGLAINKNLPNSFIDQIELSHIKSKFTSYRDIPKETQIQRTILNGIINLENDKNSTFFTLFGLGYENIHNEYNSSKGGIFIDYGIGYKHKINDYGILKADLRHMLRLSGKKHDVALVLALSIPFGFTNNHISKIDTTTIQKKVSPIKNIPKEKEVLKKIKQIILNNDSDNDGIINQNDQCKNTPNHAKVDINGCIISLNLNINFEYKSSEIKKEYLHSLNILAIFLNENTTYNVIINAYTDSIGSEKYNYKLSQDRADQTIKELIKLNINKSRLVSKAYGETNALSSNDTEEGRAQNRRVTAIIINKN